MHPHRYRPLCEVARWQHLLHSCHLKVKLFNWQTDRGIKVDTYQSSSWVQVLYVIRTILDPLALTKWKDVFDEQQAEDIAAW